MRSRIALGLALAAVLVVLSSQTHFFYRDNFSTHYPTRVVAAELLRAGEIPLWNRFAGGGQPLGGNPNTLVFYPDSILYLAFPARVAFNLHFWIHLLAGFFAMRALLRAVGCKPGESLIGAALYVASGAAVSSLAFYNLVTAIALVPLAFLAVERLVDAPTARRALLLGAAFGLLALAGEPVMIVAIAASSIVLAARRLTRRVIGFAALAIVVAAIIVSPLLIAYSEIASESERAAHGYSTETVLAASLSPLRFLEMIIGPFRGLATDYGPGGYAATTRSERWPPLFLTLFAGAIVIPAIFAGVARRYVVLFATLAFFALGMHNAVVVALLDRFAWLRIVRYPEKLAIPMTAAAVVLIALWLDRDPDNRRARGAAIASIVLLAVPLLAPRLFGVEGTAGILRMLAGSLVAMATLAAFVSRARRTALALTFLALGFWWIRAVPIDWAAPYESPSSLASDLAGRRIFASSPRGTTAPNARLQYRSSAELIEPLFGAVHGVRYALDRSPEGMYSFLSRIVEERMRTAGGDAKIRYLQLTGCDAVVSRTPIARPELRLERTFETRGEAAHLYEVSNTTPRAWVVTRTIGARSIQDAVRVIESVPFEPRTMAIVPARGELPTGSARILAIVESPQSLAIEVDAASAATIVVNESYFSAWRARIGGDGLRTFPANIDRLGVVIPQGRSTVLVEFGRLRTLIAIAWVVSMVALIGSVLLSRRP